MRFPLAPLAFAAVFILPASGLLAQYTPPMDPATMLSNLKQLKDKQSQTAKFELTKTIQDFSAAAGNDAAALNFYIEAVRVTQFVGQDHEQTAFRDWKKKEVDKLKPPAIRAALQYTVLTLQRAAGAKDEQIFGPLLSYAQSTESMLPTIGDAQILREAVNGNIFAKWYNISGQLAGLDNWEMSPGNVEGMYQQVLLPFMRKNKDQRILQYWDKKIKDETDAASAAASAFTVDRFNQTRRPDLLWSRAEDCIAVDLRDQGLNTMYTIIKNFPDHPSNGKWIEELTGLLTPPPASPGNTTGSAAAPPAPAQ